MTAIPPKFLDSVVAIGFPGTGGIRWAATGFLYGHFLRGVEEGESLYQSFLVTNRHVLAGEDEGIIRFNPLGVEPAREYRTALVDDGTPLWTPHPDTAIDVAVLPIDGRHLTAEGVAVEIFRDNFDALFRDEAVATGLAEGDPVFVLGFPMGLVGGSRSYVIVRQGVIARVRDWLAGAANEFLVDASIFPGNSGGPVVSGPSVRSVTGSPPPRDRSQLLGVVSGFLPWTDVAVSGQTGRPRVTFEENSGLGSIVPVDYVREAVRAFRTAHPDAPPPHGDVSEAAPETGEATPPTP